ncbi:hypothetical protein [Halosolutus gelatinilyticus]|nr:hypothetical protein [Halosolutus gelatinilyticus]
MSFDQEFVTTVASTDLDETDDDGFSLRTAVFADLMTQIWDAKGDLQTNE